MQDFSAEILALRRILGLRKTYRETIFRIIAIEKIAPSSVKELKRNVFGVLRHYFSLAFEVDSLFPSFAKDSDERYLSLVALYQLRHRKDQKKEDIQERFCTTSLLMHLQGDFAKNYAKLENAALKPFAIPESLKSKPYTYNSLALEIPDFLLKDLVFSYGPQKAREMAFAIRDIPVPSFVRNRLVPGQESLGECRQVKTDIDTVYLLSKGKNETADHLVKEGFFHPLELIKAMAVSSLPSFPVEMDCLLLNQRLPFLPIYLNGIYGDLPGLRITPVFASEERYRSAIDFFVQFRATKVHPLLAEMDLVKTYFSYDSMDVVVLQGTDIGIGKVGMRPDILPDLTEKDVRDSAYRQTKELLTAADFVKKQGYLLFINAGLTAPETRNVRESFLSLRKNFAVVQDSYLLPTQYKTESGYYCLFRRER